LSRTHRIVQERIRQNAVPESVTVLDTAFPPGGGDNSGDWRLNDMTREENRMALLLTRA